MLSRPILIISIFYQTEGGLLRFRPVGVKCKNSPVDILLKKQKLVVIHTLRQIEISALNDSHVTNTPSVKMLFPQKKRASPYIFEKKIHVYILVYYRYVRFFFLMQNCLSVGNEKLLLYGRCIRVNKC